MRSPAATAPAVTPREDPLAGPLAPDRPRVAAVPGPGRRGPRPLRRLGPGPGQAVERRGARRPGRPPGHHQRRPVQADARAAVRAALGPGAAAPRRRPVDRAQGRRLRPDALGRRGLQADRLGVAAGPGPDAPGAPAQEPQGRHPGASSGPGKDATDRWIAELRREHPDKRVEVWAEDEARLGLKPIVRRVWAPRGQRPTANGRTRYQWLYVYGFVHPASGRNLELILPAANADWMGLALAEFARWADPAGGSSWWCWWTTPAGTWRSGWRCRPTWCCGGCRRARRSCSRPSRSGRWCGGGGEQGVRRPGRDGAGAGGAVPVADRPPRGGPRGVRVLLGGGSQWLVIRAIRYETGNTEQIRITVGEFQGKLVTSARLWFKARPAGPDDDGWRPSKSGVTIREHELGLWGRCHREGPGDARRAARPEHPRVRGRTSPPPAGGRGSPNCTPGPRSNGPTRSRIAYPRRGRRSSANSATARRGPDG